MVCSDCGDELELSARNAREHRRRGTSARCHDCRIPERPLTEAERERYRRWWETRFTRNELVELARAIWPEDDAHRTLSPS